MKFEENPIENLRMTQEESFAEKKAISIVFLVIFSISPIFNLKFTNKIQISILKLVS